MVEFDISYSNLTSLIGVTFPENVRRLYCHNNRLTSLKGCPLSLQHLYCDNNQLTNLEDCSPSVQELWHDNNPLNTEYRNKSLEEIHKINRIKAYRKGILILNSIIFPTVIQRFFRYHYYDKLNSNGISLFCLRSMEEDKKSGIII